MAQPERTGLQHFVPGQYCVMQWLQNSILGRLWLYIYIYKSEKDLQIYIYIHPIQKLFCLLLYGDVTQKCETFPNHMTFTIFSSISGEHSLAEIGFAERSAGKCKNLSCVYPVSLYLYLYLYMYMRVCAFKIYTYMFYIYKYLCRYIYISYLHIHVL